MKESEVIIGVIDLLSKPGSWIQFSRGNTVDDEPVSPLDPEAVKFCLGGAVMRVLQDEEWEGWWETADDPIGSRLHKLAVKRGFQSPDGYPFVDFNNHPDTTQEDVIGLLKDALCETEMEESSK